MSQERLHEERLQKIQEARRKPKKKGKNVDTSADSTSVAQEISGSNDGELVLVSASSRQFDDT